MPILSWYEDPKDRALFELIPLLETLAEVDDIRKYIPRFVTTDNRVDFQRASYVLSNANPRQLQPSANILGINNKIEIADQEIAEIDDDDEEVIIDEDPDGGDDEEPSPLKKSVKAEVTSPTPTSAGK